MSFLRNREGTVKQRKTDLTENIEFNNKKTRQVIPMTGPADDVIVPVSRPTSWKGGKIRTKIVKMYALIIYNTRSK